MNPPESIKTTDSNLNEWQAKLAARSYANGRPEIVGAIRDQPEDFRVTELMTIEPSGNGEHYWLDISKRRMNTDQVAKALARFAGVAYRDVGYSGLKDYHAITRQWFSVWRPGEDKKASLDWDAFSDDRIEVHLVTRHSRKIKRNTHLANHFEIVVRDIECSRLSHLSVTLEAYLEERLANIRRQGVPNYFGEQRFGRNANNMNQAYQMLVGKQRVKKGNLRGLLFSAARSWLFNCIVSERVKDGSWMLLKPNEPVNLNGSNSHFINNETEQSSGELTRRLTALDIHPTAPMWGDGVDQLMTESQGLAQWERSVLLPHKSLCDGLVAARVKYQRRPLRFVAQNLKWSFVDNQLHLCFDLAPGQFATSLLREIVRSKPLAEDACNPDQ